MSTEPTAPSDEPVIYSATTPSGTVVEYSPAPRRFYRVNGTEVPSVTTVLGCLDKPGLPWFGMVKGVEGTMELFRRKVVGQHWRSVFDGDEIAVFVDAFGGEVDAGDVVRFLTQEKLTVNHVRDRAGDRGTSVHAALEDWCKTGTVPHPEIYPESEAGYIEGLVKFIRDFDAGGVAYPQVEVMVGSAKNGFAGRYDLRCYFNGGELVTKSYPKREDKREKVPAGEFLLDLKTSSGVYPSHYAQLAAYELASVECGYTPTDHQAVIHVTADGRYEFVASTATAADFLAILNCYQALQRLKGKAA